MKDTWTEHSHGVTWHDHEGGGLPHDHYPSANPFRGVACLTFGIMIMVFGGLAMFWQSANHSMCGSVLPQISNQSVCAEANGVWTIGIAALIAGGVLMIAGAILRAK